MSVAAGTEREHTHRWLIAMQHGPTSVGTCECGETKDFQNGWHQPSNDAVRGHTVRRWRG